MQMLLTIFRRNEEVAKKIDREQKEKRAEAERKRLEAKRKAEAASSAPRMDNESAITELTNEEAELLQLQIDQQ